MKSTITLRLSDDMRSDLDDIASSSGLAVSDLVRSSLERLIAIKKLELVRKKISPFARKAKLVTDEDILALKS